ncbi:hypothetical protein [Streptomyces sp. NPDC017940]|uniref:hypothetical protein n=1 Tax=Streptomyces sp. NPDC017940 TaxID=3365017 RepID=UPI00379942E3
MHHHGYLWTGPKQHFDDEALRRPPPPHAPPEGSRPELVRRHREVKAEFPVVDLPPAAERNRERLALLAECAVVRLGWGGDVSLGCYLERPTFLSLALVCCSPNRTMPQLDCPAQTVRRHQ